jgi:hypothetical protein
MSFAIASAGQQSPNTGMQPPSGSQGIHELARVGRAARG